jgi:hypothetical protein
VSLVQLTALLVAAFAYPIIAQTQRASVGSWLNQVRVNFPASYASVLATIGLPLGIPIAAG